jgi:hypothetical protein
MFVLAGRMKTQREPIDKAQLRYRKIDVPDTVK